MSELEGVHSSPTKGHFKLTVLRGFFSQDQPDTAASTFDYVKDNFGLIPRSYSDDESSQCAPLRQQWQRLGAYLSQLNIKCPASKQYKLLYLARHGQGVHNVAEARHGRLAWDEHYSKLNGDEYGSWVDAALTPLGVTQAKQASSFWASLIPVGVPLPQVYIVSPLDRCLTTARITFSDLALPESRPYKPIVKENLREVNGVHTCDQRSKASMIKQRYPEVGIEDGFTEDDELWDAEHRETDPETDDRIRKLLDEVFAIYTECEVISFTSHSGAIRSILRVLGYREFRLPTGSVLPVLVEAQQNGT